MRIRQTTVPCYALALALLGSLPLAGSARAEGEPARAWVFDLRVVRVVGPPALGEAGPDWASPGGGLPVTTTPWRNLLDLLKQRGETTVLLDRRVTAVSGEPASIADTQVAAARVFERRDRSNETWRAGVIETGVRGDLLADARTTYKIDVKWELGGGDPEAVPLQGSAAWTGSWPLLGGETLVLTHRQQLARPGGGTGVPAGVEIYAFLTARPVP
jgi:hypothetical protein